MRVIAAVERALATGQVQELAPYHRAKHPLPDQAFELPPITVPPLVNATPPEG